MPEIFREYGFIFFFYTNEHLPIHVHVRKGGGEAKFVIEDNDEVVLYSSYNMKVKELAKAEELVIHHKEEIINAWTDYFKQ